MIRTKVVVPDETFSGMASFVDNFYEISDTPNANEEYADQFNRDGSAEVMGKKYSGRDEIFNWRQNAWKRVKERTHIPIKIYTHGPEDIVVFGRVKMVFSDGTDDEDEFVANMKFDKDLRLLLYKANGLK